MALRDLFSPGSHLSDVPADFRGMPLKEWQRKTIEKQAEEYRATLDPADAPLSKKAVWTPRDSYGIKGL